MVAGGEGRVLRVEQTVLSTTKFMVSVNSEEYERENRRSQRSGDCYSHKLDALNFSTS